MINGDCDRKRRKSSIQAIQPCEKARALITGRVPTRGRSSVSADAVELLMPHFCSVLPTVECLPVIIIMSTSETWRARVYEMFVLSFLGVEIVSSAGTVDVILAFRTDGPSGAV